MQYIYIFDKLVVPILTITYGSEIRGIYEFKVRAGSRQMESMQMHRSEKKLQMHSSVRFLPQIMRNNTFCENTRHNAKISTKLLFPRNEYKAYSQINF